MGASVARAVAIARVTDAATGLRLLGKMVTAETTLDVFQTYHAVRAALLIEFGDTETARITRDRAIDLCTHPPSRRSLEELKQH